MKLITTIYSSYELEVIMTAQPRASRDIEGNRIENTSMLKRHTSKVGNVSLIFNPSVFLTIRPKRWTGDITPDATILAHQIYRFNNLLIQVWNNALGKDVFREDNGLFLDQKATAAAARRMSLYRYALTMFPDIIGGPDNTQQKAVAFQVDKTKLGSMSLVEVAGLTDAIDHLDLTTYSLAAGLLEEIQDLHTADQIIIDKLTRIENLLSAGSSSIQPKPQRNSSAAGIFDWKPASSEYSLGS